MKRLYDYRMLVSINGGPYRDTSVWKHIKYLSPEEAKTKESAKMSLNEAYEIAEDIMNAEKGITFFKKRKYIGFSFADSFERVCLYEGTVQIKEVYLPCDCSMDTLIEVLNTEEFIQYLKDRGIFTCPMIKG